jgi:hypothetical protein
MLPPRRLRWSHPQGNLETAKSISRSVSPHIAWLAGEGND